MKPAVWAPDLGRVRVVVDGTPHPMERGPDGWWRCDLEVSAGTDYAFLLDDDETPLPDPRSPWQPQGVHAASRVLDHGAFAWTDAGWQGRALKGAVVYELHVGTYSPEGTFDGVVARLDHLVDLGVDLVELLPVNSFDGPHGWGYDGVAWYAPHEPYGGPDGLKRLVDACHARGLGVVLDVVYNHLGPSGAYLDRFGPYFAGENDWGPGLNLDKPGSDEVRRYVLDNVAQWFEDYHLDGLRLDAVHALKDGRALTLLESLAAETDARAERLGRPLTLVAEWDANDPRMVIPRDEHGLGMAAQWCDDVHHALHVRLTGETSGYYADFAEDGALEKVLNGAYFHDGTWSSFRGRHHGRPVDPGTPGMRFLAYLQTHDQVGNRATGDRLAATVSRDLLACAAAIVLLGPFTPMLFMGEEWGARTPWQFFASFPDPALADAVRTGRRREFGRHGWDEQEVPDPMDVATFERSRLDWSEPTAPGHRELLDTHRTLIRLRHEHPQLSDPTMGGVRVERAGSLVVMPRGDLLIVANLGMTGTAVDVGDDVEVLHTSAPVELHEGRATVRPHAFAVLRTG